MESKQSEIYKKDFADRVEEALKCSSELIRYSALLKTLPDGNLSEAGLMERAADTISWMANAIKVYDKNLEASVKLVLNTSRETKRYARLWAFAELVLDEQVRDAISLLADRVKERTDDKDVMPDEAG